MIEYLKEIFGKENIKEKEFKIKDMPVYLMSYQYELISLYNKDFLFMKSKNININSYKTHSKFILENYKYETVLVLNMSKETQRKNLIDNHLMFVEERKYIFMPSIGLIFNNSLDEIKKDIYLTESEERIAKIFVYAKKNILSTSDIILLSGFNKMMVSRALKKLDDLNLISHEIKGKSFYYKKLDSKEVYLDKLLEIINNPVKCIKVINRKKLPKDIFVSSYSALSRFSDLSDNDETYAIYVKDMNLEFKKLKDYFDGMILNESEVKLEIWNTNPKNFSINGCAELISVMKSINDNDERVLSAIEEVKETLTNEQRIIWTRKV